MNIDITTIINAVIALIGAIITYKVVPWIKTKTTVEQQKLLEATVKTLVFAAEQLYGSGWGQEKLNYVVTRLESSGYTVDMDMIEAAVMRCFNIKVSVAPEDYDAEGEEEEEEDEETQTPLS